MSDTCVIELEDSKHEHHRVWLLSDLWKREAPKPLTFEKGKWRITLADLPLDRIETAFLVESEAGARRRILDEHAPVVITGGWNERLLSTYRPPSWTRFENAPPCSTSDLRLETALLPTPVRARLLAPAGLDPTKTAPLVVVHDGSDAVRFGQFDAFLRATVAAKRLRPFRALLLDPIDREEHYSASPEYASVIAREILPQVREHVRVPSGSRHVIGLGASLGALAHLHVATTYPNSYGSLALQSGSYFRSEFDANERWFRHFDRIESFVASIPTRNVRPLHIALSVGRAEENLANNRSLARALRRAGHEVSLKTKRDLHNWVAFRDAFEDVLRPHLG